MTIVHPTETHAEATADAPRLGGRPRTPRAYALACAWCEADPGVRLRRSKQAAAAYRSISLLPRPWGEALDKLGASHRELRWLAGTTGHAHAAAREARYLALVKMIREADPTARGAAFEALMRAMPTVRRRRGSAG